MTTLVVRTRPANLLAHAKTRVLVAPVTTNPSENHNATTPQEIIEQWTVANARSAGHPELGMLSEGAPADVALLENIAGRLRCILTIRAGVVVWDAEGLATTDWVKAGPYSNFK